jgi:O-antigen/teichoic acid export membrane protein
MWSSFGQPGMRAAVAAIGANAALGASSLITAVVIARLLGDAGKGIVTYVVTIVVIAGILLDFGMSHAVVVELRKRLVAEQVVVANAVGWVLAMGGVGGAVAATLTWAGIAFPDTVMQPMLIGSLIPLALGNVVFRQVMLANRRRSHFNWSVVAETALVACACSVALVTRAVWSPQQVVACYALGMGVSIVILIHGLPRVAPLSAHVGRLRESLRFGVRAHAGTVLQFVNYRVDVLLTASISGAAALGVYSVGYTVAEIVWRVPRVAAMLAYPRFASMPQAAAAQLAVSIVTVIAVANVVIATGVAALVVVFIEPVFGRSFVGAVTVCLVLIPGVFVAGLQIVLLEQLKAHGSPGSKTVASIAGLVCTIGLGVPLIAKHGAIGAAVTSTVAYSCSAGVAGWLFVRVNGLAPRDLFTPFRAACRSALALGTIRG